jgi:DUF1016 N-terminal domain
MVSSKIIKTVKQVPVINGDLPSGYRAVHNEIGDLLQESRRQAARNVNVLMTASYWEVGRRIVAAEQKGERRAGYGDALIKQLALDLTARFGRGFGWRNLFQMRTFFLAWPEILQTLSAISSNSNPLAQIAEKFPLAWSAYVRLLSVKDDLHVSSTKRKPSGVFGVCVN